jgi:hypothetical protein
MSFLAEMHSKGERESQRPWRAISASLFVPKPTIAIETRFEAHKCSSLLVNEERQRQSAHDSMQSPSIRVPSLRDHDTVSWTGTHERIKGRADSVLTNQRRLALDSSVLASICVLYRHCITPLYCHCPCLLQATFSLILVYNEMHYSLIVYLCLLR